MLYVRGRDVLLIQLERHIERLISVNLERNSIQVRSAPKLNEGLRLMDERIPDTVIVPDRDVREAVELSFPGSSLEIIVLVRTGETPNTI